ncbi:MAG: EAL domain-containing protein [Pseudomonadota bacterium]|nr:EAL domain-containing protein [Pseudomonadota bacterium]
MPSSSAALMQTSVNPSARGVVLVADDDPVMRMLMVEMLRQVGLDAIEAADGAEALAQARVLVPDLVMLDVDMPNMDGFAACRAIRELDNGATVPIIMVTGGDDIEAVTSAYDAGATDFVSKPINWPILGHRVLYVLRASDAIVRLRIADAHNRAVLAAIPDTFFRMDKHGVYLDYAPGHERAFRQRIPGHRTAAGGTGVARATSGADSASISAPALDPAAQSSQLSDHQHLSHPSHVSPLSHLAHVSTLSHLVPVSPLSHTQHVPSLSPLSHVPPLPHVQHVPPLSPLSHVPPLPHTQHVPSLSPLSHVPPLPHVPHLLPLSHPPHLPHLPHAGRVDHAVFPRAECVGKHISEVLPQDIAERMLEQMAAVLDTDHVRSVEYTLLQAGQCQHFEARLVATGAEEVLGLVRDISERKRTEEQIRRLAYCDSLTGIPNRQAFLETLERELQRSKVGNKKFAVLFMDLDAFKRINDTLGHNVGDNLLQIVSERLRETTRPSDVVSRGEQAYEESDKTPHDISHSTAGGGHARLPSDSPAHNLARLGGDEFTILIPDLERVEDALNVAHRVKEAMRRPFLIEGHEIFVTASIGISLFPEDGDDCNSLLKFADTAMYHAKNTGKNNAKLYSSSLTMKIMSHVKLEVGLRKAIQNDELYLLYQPQVEARTTEIVGVEALVRWRHPERGIISPTEFIPLAEETGLIVPIGEWILRTACSQAMAWQHLTRRSLRMAVNLSAKQFKDENLSQIVLSALHETGLSPGLLELELTEGTLMDDANATLATLELLRGIGVYLSIDDFGTGYSSMNYLKRFDVRTLKIDRSFISGLPQDTENAAITRAIIAMAHGLKMIVVAEGVETSEQLLLLQEYGCDLVQGYYLGHPSPHDVITHMLVKLGLETVPALALSSMSAPVSAVESAPASALESTPASAVESTPASVPASALESTSASAPASAPGSAPASAPASTQVSTSASASKSTSTR